MLAAVDADGTVLVLLLLLLLLFFFFLTLPGILPVCVGDEDMQEVQDNGHAANGQQQQQDDTQQQKGSSGGKVIDLTKSSNKVRHASSGLSPWHVCMTCDVIDTPAHRPNSCS